MTSSALVLGGGGLAGIAWETGLLAGLAAAGVDVTEVDLVLGTSAGSVVAAQVATGVPLDELLARQVDPARHTHELAPPDGANQLLWDENDHAGAVRAGSTVSEADRRAVIAARLPVHEWPARPLSVVAAEAESGEPVVFDRESGVRLVDAVAASCAVPGVWPAVTIGDARYVDGGVRSSNNVDLAAGYDRVLVLAPIADPLTAGQVDVLTAQGTRVELVLPDEAATRLFLTDLLDPAIRTPAAEAGLAQARDALAVVSRWWSP
ncbi:MAG TPA: patatin-like phospholipase family protein [Actinophytocola sp.]|jgi:NTE family protein|uniref:patatin-like phospholipase family protein n=1 Tax=Actinophytocola sp. TaxID=1872138 RepID=UPI002F942292